MTTTYVTMHDRLPRIASATGRYCSSAHARAPGSSSADAARASWTVSGPMFLGHIAQHMMLDPRDRTTMLLAMRTGHLGPTVFRSTDLGPIVAGGEASRPRSRRATRSNGRLQRRVLAHTGSRERTRRRGTPAVRRKVCSARDDGGDTWEPVRGLERSPDVGDVVRVAGGEHARRFDAALGDRRPARSRAPLHRPLGGGVFESDRRRRRLASAQRGLDRRRSCRIPNPSSATTRTVCGCIRCDPTGCTSRTTAASTAWSVRRAAGCASATTCRATVGDIGFPIELHPRDPDTAWVFPMDGTDVWPRTSPDGQPAAYVTRDAGESWTRCDAGLPERAWFTVKRQAMTVDDARSGRRLLRHDER